MWDVKLDRNGQLEGVHKCPEHRWLADEEGWANVNFFFNGERETPCACGERPPKELINLYRFHRKLICYD